MRIVPVAALLAAAAVMAGCQKTDPSPKPAPTPKPPQVSLPVEVSAAPEAPPATVSPEQVATAPEAPLTQAPGVQPPPAPPVAATPPAPPTARPQTAPERYDLTGTEPFWNMHIREDGLTLARAGHADLKAENPGSNEFGKTSMWNATVGQSRMTVTVTRAACTDGMSDRTYAYAAKVKIWTTTLSGCATRVK